MSEDGGGVPMPLLLAAERREGEAEGEEAVVLRTDAGDVEGRLHPVEGGGTAAVLWLCGARAGLGGPAGGLYPRLARALRQDHGIASLEIAWRHPGDPRPCMLDALLALTRLAGLGPQRVVLVGHSFGGAVAISAGGIATDLVAGVATLASQTAGTLGVSRISPRPLLLMHGTADEVLPDACSRWIHAQAGEPKRLVLYPGARHRLDECREALERDLTAWILEVLGGQAAV
jgi:pimeloyl-ACP methyl ester carboxylesterase